MVYVVVGALTAHTNPLREEWQDDASCADIGSELFFPPDRGGKAYIQARKICGSCTVREECLEYILAHEGKTNDRYGMFGGMTPRQRFEIFREREAQNKDEEVTSQELHVL